MQSNPRERKPNPITHYIIVRNDLPKGMQCAQITHAAGESANDKIDSNTHAVVLETHPQGLLDLHLTLRHEGVAYSPIFEQVEEYKDQLMAIGIAPAARRLIKPYVSSLPLVR
jgi:hypothetical protein